MTDDFDARLDALLAAKGYTIHIYQPIELRNGRWGCSLHPTFGKVHQGHGATAREAIEAAKQMARERDTKNG